jgi:protein phosphatase
MLYGALSDIGKKRKINEDNYHVETDGPFPYVIVADGMGGHQAGEVASLMAVDIIENHLAKYLDDKLDYVEASEVVRRAFLAANKIIYNYAKDHYTVMGMGTTTTFAMIYSNKIITAHVGDSRAYAIDDYSIRQLTRDHSYVQELVSMGRLTPTEAKTNSRKNFITRAMGAEETVKVDISIEPYNGEKLLLCSDGLTNHVEDDEIFNYVKYSQDLQSAVQNMIDLANRRGGTDNITTAVICAE